MSPLPIPTIDGSEVALRRVNDIFFQFVDAHVCNFADDTTLTACNVKMNDLLHELEDNTLSAIIWFENNYMKLNQSKCHFLTCGSPEHLWVRVGDEKIWRQIGNKENTRIP